MPQHPGRATRGRARDSRQRAAPRRTHRLAISWSVSQMPTASVPTSTGPSASGGSGTSRTRAESLCPGWTVSACIVGICPKDHVENVAGAIRRQPAACGGRHMRGLRRTSMRAADGTTGSHSRSGADTADKPTSADLPAPAPSSVSRAGGGDSNSAGASVSVPRPGPAAVRPSARQPNRWTGPGLPSGTCGHSGPDAF